MTAPVIHTIDTHHGIADTVSITVTMSYPDIDGTLAELPTDHYRTVAFVGTIHGSPGPITVITEDGMQSHVFEAYRFGPIFNESWVEAFYADDTPVND
jgi:hypothetical protein